MQVLSSKQPMLKALQTFAVRDGKRSQMVNIEFLLTRIGIRSLWSGLSASILRQTIYSTARFALYDILARQVQQRSGAKLTVGSTIMCAGVAGGLAGMLGNPTEVCVFF